VRPARILIVEDDRPIRESLKAYLEDCGFESHGAPDSDGALSFLENSSVDAIIMDLRLPSISGEELIRQIHARWPRVVFTIFTGSLKYRIPDDLAQLDCVSDRVFLKPLDDLGVLVDELKRLLQTRKKDHGNDHNPDHR
jgi:DNA-binding response OmpR family regulator